MFLVYIYIYKFQIYIYIYIYNNRWIQLDECLQFTFSDPNLWPQLSETWNHPTGRYPPCRWSWYFVCGCGTSQSWCRTSDCDLILCSKKFTIRLSEIVKVLSYSFMLQFLPLHYIQYNMYSRYVFILHKLFWLFLKSQKTKIWKPYDFTTGKPTVFSPSSPRTEATIFGRVFAPRLGLGIPIKVVSSRENDVI